VFQQTNKLLYSLIALVVPLAMKFQTFPDVPRRQDCTRTAKQLFSLVKDHGAWGVAMLQCDVFELDLNIKLRSKF